jgi:hypothetical protein
MGLENPVTSPNEKINREFYQAPLLRLLHFFTLHLQGMNRQSLTATLTSPELQAVTGM